MGRRLRRATRGVSALLVGLPLVLSLAGAGYQALGEARDAFPPVPLLAPGHA